LLKSKLDNPTLKTKVMVDGMAVSVSSKTIWQTVNAELVRHYIFPWIRAMIYLFPCQNSQMYTPQHRMWLRYETKRLTSLQTPCMDKLLSEFYCKMNSSNILDELKQLTQQIEQQNVTHSITTQQKMALQTLQFVLQQQQECEITSFKFESQQLLQSVNNIQTIGNLPFPRYGFDPYNTLESAIRTVLRFAHDNGRELSDGELIYLKQQSPGAKSFYIAFASTINDFLVQQFEICDSEQNIEFRKKLISQLNQSNILDHKQCKAAFPSRHQTGHEPKHANHIITREIKSDTMLKQKTSTARTY
jgi:hypothetical protein